MTGYLTAVRKHGDSDGLTESERYQLLASDRRRLTLDVLDGRTDPVDIEDLAAGIAARENGLGATDEEAIERVMIALHHSHLPKMADLGVIDYDLDANRVESCSGLLDA